MINSHQEIYKEFSDINMNSIMDPTKKDLIDIILKDKAELVKVINKLFFMLSERERKLVLINI